MRCTMKRFPTSAAIRTTSTNGREITSGGNPNANELAGARYQRAHVARIVQKLTKN
jgi:hypothetical protein